MKTTRKGLTILLLLFTILLSQSCVMYHKTPVTMEQAAQEKIKTRIVLQDKSIEKFKYITNENEQYYGTRLTGNGPITIPIDVNDVSEVRIKHKMGSVLLTTIPLGALATFVTIGIVGWQ